MKIELSYVMFHQFNTANNSDTDSEYVEHLWILKSKTLDQIKFKIFVQITFK
jgi:hypothetical protein